MNIERRSCPDFVNRLHTYIWLHIQGTKEDLEALANPTSNSAAKIFNGSAVFLPAPFLSKAIFNAGTGYPFELILVALKTAEYLTTPMTLMKYTQTRLFYMPKIKPCGHMEWQSERYPKPDTWSDQTTENSKFSTPNAMSNAFSQL